MLYLVLISSLIHLIGAIPPGPAVAPVHPRHKYPWMVRLHSVFSNVTTGQFVNNQTCGAALVKIPHNKKASDILITATQCVQYQLFNMGLGVNLDSITAFVGDFQVNETDRGERVRGIKRAKASPYFNQSLTKYQHGLSIIQLDCPVIFSDKVQPIHLPELDDSPVGLTNCAFAGWGFHDPDVLANVLYSIDINIQTDVDCQFAYDHSLENAAYGFLLDVDSSVNYCMVAKSQNTSVNCGMDSGSPFFCKKNNKWIAYGTAMIGDHDCTGDPGWVGVTTKNGLETSWIRDTIHEWSYLDDY